MINNNICVILEAKNLIMLTKRRCMSLKSVNGGHFECGDRKNEKWNRTVECIIQGLKSAVYLYINCKLTTLALQPTIFPMINLIVI